MPVFRNSSLVPQKPQSALLNMTYLYLLLSPKFTYAVKEFTIFQESLLRISDIPARYFISANKIKYILELTMPHFMLACCSADKCETSFCGQIYNPMEPCCLNSLSALWVARGESKPPLIDICQPSWASWIYTVIKKVTGGTHEQKHLL